MKKQTKSIGILLAFCVLFTLSGMGCEMPEAPEAPEVNEVNEVNEAIEAAEENTEE